MWGLTVSPTPEDAQVSTNAQIILCTESLGPDTTFQSLSALGQADTTDHGGPPTNYIGDYQLLPGVFLHEMFHREDEDICRSGNGGVYSESIFWLTLTICLVEDAYFVDIQNPGQTYRTYNAESIAAVALYPDRFVRAPSEGTEAEPLDSTSFPDAYRLFCTASFLNFRTWSYSKEASTVVTQ